MSSVSVAKKYLYFQGSEFFACIIGGRVATACLIWSRLLQGTIIRPEITTKFNEPKSKRILKHKYTNKFLSEKNARKTSFLKKNKKDSFSSE